MKSSINDKPIANISEDRLEIKGYVDALSSFIVEGETPLTVGLQGEWGTGKTSIMNLIREEIVAKQIPTCWLNTWEHSLFTDPVETTPKLLRAMMKNLEQDNAERNYIPQGKGEDVRTKINGVGTKLAKIANQALIKKTGVNLIDALGDGDFTNSENVEISALKADVETLLRSYIDAEQNTHQRIVFFIDDLDRIEPSRAVEILEALKNLLDFDGCVFVLAIDYEVVVSGLRRKFGERKDQNDREFRSFFDKIIQVPFHIPTDKYDIKNFLAAKFKSFGTPDLDEEFIKDCSFFVRNTLGKNPRALKRQLNLFNLSSRILSADTEDEDQDQSDGNQPNLQSINLALFALICIQVSYDDLFKYIILQANDLSALNSKNKLVDAFFNESKHDLLRKFRSEIQNILDKFEEKSWLQQDSALAGALRAASVTSVGAAPIRDKKARSEILLEEHFELNKVSKSQRDLILEFIKFVKTLQYPLAIKATEQQLSFYDHKNRDKNRGVICYLQRRKDRLTVGLKGDKNQDGSSNEKLKNLAIQLKNMGLDNARFEIDKKHISSLKIDISDQVLKKQSEQVAHALSEHKEIFVDKGWYKWSENAE